MVMLLQKSQQSIQVRLGVVKVILFSIITICHPAWPSTSNLQGQEPGASGDNNKDNNSHHQGLSHHLI